MRLGVGFAELAVGHFDAGRHQCFREVRELADDLFVVGANERAQGHSVLWPFRSAGTSGRGRTVTLAVGPPVQTLIAMLSPHTPDPYVA